MKPKKTGGRAKDPAYHAAKQRGEKTYVPREECLNGHKLRYTSSRRCVHCSTVGEPCRAV